MTFGNNSVRWSLAGLKLLAVSIAAAVWAQNVPTFRSGVFLVHADIEVGPKWTSTDRVNQGGFPCYRRGPGTNDLGLLRQRATARSHFAVRHQWSMRKQVKKVAAVADEGLKELRDGDRVSVMAFSSVARVISTFSESLDVAERAIQDVVNLRFGGGTFIQDAVNEAANRFIWFDDQDHPRRAVLVITDDLGRPTRHKKAVIESLWEADALLSGVVLRNRLAELIAPGARLRLGGIEDFVEKTGGDLIRSDDLSQSFPEMMHRIRSRYTLYYKLPEGQVGSLRKIDVRLSGSGWQRFPNARVLARRAYRLRQQDQHGFTKR